MRVSSKEPTPFTRQTFPEMRAEIPQWKLCNCFFWLVALITFHGCAATLPGQSLVNQGQTEAAIPVLREDIEAGSNPSRLTLAKVLSERGEATEAESLLREAVQIDPGMSESWFRLGLLLEDQERWGDAIEAYGQYNSLRPRSPFRSEMKDRITVLSLKESEAWAKSITQQEDQLQLGSPIVGTVAIYTFDDQKTETLRGIGAAMASQLNRDLAQLGGYTLVERRNIDAILRELELSKQGFLSEEAAPRTSLFLQVESFVLGSVTELSNDNMRIDMTWVSRDGRAPVSVHTSGSTDRFWNLQKDLTRQLLSAQGRELTDGEWALVEVSGSTDLQAFVSYGQGLEYERFGAYEDAREAYRQALEEDQDFLAAMEGQSRTNARDLPLSEFSEKIEEKDSGDTKDITQSHLLGDMLNDLVDEVSLLPDEERLTLTVPSPPGPPSR